VIALSRGDAAVRRFIERAHADGSAVCVPVVVVAETARGNGPRDAPVNLVLHRLAPHPLVDEPLARTAGSLLAESRTDNTVDALVAAEAARLAPALLLTGDPDDMSALLGDRRGVVVTPIPTMRA
jgi:predicted nucleic acid-binding protein